MSDYKGFQPKGRRSLPTELMQMGKHLVYSEGTKTEPHYVKNIKKNIAQKYNRQPNEILLIPVCDDKTRHTVNLVDYAIQDVQKKLEKGETVHHAWILFDKDDFADFEEAHNRINALNDSKNRNPDGFLYNRETGVAWHSCWSNACFELWLCLYFDYCNVPLDRNDYGKVLEDRPSLKKIGFRYEKNAENIHDVLTKNGGSLKNAIKYAKKLEKENGVGDPSTGMHLFAAYFQPYMNR